MLYYHFMNGSAFKIQKKLYLLFFGGVGLKCEHLFIENTASFELVGGRRRQKKGRRGRNGAAEPQGQS